MSSTAAAPSQPRPHRYAREVVINLLAAPVFIVAVGLVPEPYRQISMATLLVIAAVVYLGHGLGRLEWVFAAILAGCAVAGLYSYAAIGLGWLLHTISDVLHHRINRPLVARLPLSSFGCAVFDPLIAVWFFLGAPSVIPL